MSLGAILVPGIITPAEIAYGRLLEAFAGTWDVSAKDLAVYDSDPPPADYDLETEVSSVVAFAQARGFARFHLVGYSAGGAVSAALAARHPGSLASLTLMEPAWIGNENLTSGEVRFRAGIAAAMELPPDEALAEFARLHLRPGATMPPPPGPPPDWMRLRPAGIRAFTTAFRNHRLDAATLGALAVPVLFVLGGQTNPDFYEYKLERARRLFSDFTLETFPDRHHFDPPHRAEPRKLAAVLTSFWERAEQAAAA